jgi:hypothetical protein
LIGWTVTSAWKLKRVTENKTWFVGGQLYTLDEGGYNQILQIVRLGRCEPCSDGTITTR